MKKITLYNDADTDAADDNGLNDADDLSFLDALHKHL